MEDLLVGSYRIQTIRTGLLAPEECWPVAKLIESLYLWFSPESTLEDMAGRLCQHREARVDLLIDKATEECRGFSVYYIESHGDKRVMFRGGSVVGDRSRGFYKTLLKRSIECLHPDFVVAMTQNPRVYETLRALSQNGVAYPSPATETPPACVCEVARVFCKKSAIDLATFIVPNVYASIRKEKSFKTARDPAVTTMFASNLGENDAFFVVVPLP